MQRLRAILKASKRAAGLVAVLLLWLLAQLPLAASGPTFVLSESRVWAPAISDQTLSHADRLLRQELHRSNAPPTVLFASDDSVSPASGGPGSQRWMGKTRKDGQPYSKPGPKTDRRSPHNMEIRRTILEHRRRGYEHVGGGNRPELVIRTPGGRKPIRRPDASFRDPDTGDLFHFNVGRRNLRGDPIFRERSALRDLREAGNQILFRPYYP
jgi:hypothetical protein